ncbi:hypothetical protein BKA00_000260 [Actinomadura coerulea]|uniref:Uncharacterized protein n=1 Tax=Actinomadura coerulea TaxID=46159 RepID=A0A7X0KWJ1_9ACTN|nr:hypothetical protein [Actinomadura coerulea]
MPAPVPGADAGGALGPCAAGAFTGVLGAGGTGGRGAGAGWDCGCGAGLGAPP